MEIKNIIKNNIKLIIILGVIILLGTIGITFALVSTFNPIVVNTTTSRIDAKITYDSGTNSSLISTTGGEILPISDLIIEEEGEAIDNPKVIKAQFNVAGLSTNPENTIYDVALYANDSNGLDCILRSEDVKWRLYKNGELISNGNLSPSFDTMADNRLVLTNTQQDLTLTPDKYTFILWISESCTGDITTCDPTLVQNKYLNKSLNVSLKIELATKTKKTLKRITSTESSCSYEDIIVPACNHLIYNSNEQTLINTSSYYILENNTGNNAGLYKSIIKLKEGYKWSDGTTEDKTLNCTIAKKEVIITTTSQNTSYNGTISTNLNNLTVEGLLSGHSLKSALITPSSMSLGTNKINVSNAVIIDSNNNDVTNNYEINYNNTGTLTVNCQNISSLPNVLDYKYTGSQITGVTGGSYIDISGVTTANKIGTYEVKVKPKPNYCWSDSTTDEKILTWSIIDNVQTIILDDQISETTSNGTSTIYYKDNTYYTNSTFTKQMTKTTNPISLPIKIGYIFAGYYTEINGNGTQMIDSNGYATEALLNTTIASSQSTKLYANWQQKTYTITYDANGGTGAPPSQTKKYGESIILSNIIPTNNKKIFMGWSTNKNSQIYTHSPSDTYTINANITLYAIWLPNNVVEYITNLYLINKNKIVKNYDNDYVQTMVPVEYQYAESVNLMNDRLGGTTADYDAGNIRYYGKSPNNYVDIGDRTSDNQVILYRIIGLFKDIELADGTKKDLIKVIRDESIGNHPYHNDDQGEWHKASLMKLLNPGYESNTVGGSLWWNSKSGTCYADYGSNTKSCDFTSIGLSSNVQNKIETVVSYLGYIDPVGNLLFPAQLYLQENESPNKWTGKVFIMNTSDYAYATDFNSCDNVIDDYDAGNCYNNDWIFDGTNQWQLNNLNLFSEDVKFFVDSAGDIEYHIQYGLPYYPWSVRPVFYLNSELEIMSGDGTSNNPYVLEYQ